MRQKGQVTQSSLKQQIAIETSTVETLRHSIGMSKAAKELAEGSGHATRAHTDSLTQAETRYEQAKERLAKLLKQQEGVDAENARVIKLIDQQFDELEKEIIDQQFDALDNEQSPSGQPASPISEQPQGSNTARPLPPPTTRLLQPPVSSPLAQHPEQRPEASQPISHPALSVGVQGHHSPALAAATSQTAVASGESLQEQAITRLAITRLVEQAHIALKEITADLSERSLENLANGLTELFTTPATRESRLRAVNEAFRLSVLDPGTAEGNHTLNCLYTLRAFSNHLPDESTLPIEAGTENTRSATADPALPIQRIRVANPQEQTFISSSIRAAGFLYNFILPREAIAARQFEEAFFKPTADIAVRQKVLRNLGKEIKNFLSVSDSTDSRYTDVALYGNLKLLQHVSSRLPPNVVYPRPAPIVGAMTGSNDVIDAGLWQLQEWGKHELSFIYDHLKDKAPGAALSLAQAFTTPTPPQMRQDLLEKITSRMINLPNPDIKRSLETLRDCAMKFSMNNILEFRSEESERRKRVAL
ncbi:hypothetical protein ACFQDN_23270 [Pseudomonas asuensis]